MFASHKTAYSIESDLDLNHLVFNSLLFLNDYEAELKLQEMFPDQNSEVEVSATGQALVMVGPVIMRIYSHD